MSAGSEGVPGWENANWTNPQWRGTGLHCAGGSLTPMVNAAFTVFASDLDRYLFFCAWARRARYVVSIDLGQHNTLACLILDVSAYPETGCVTVVDTFLARNDCRRAHRRHYGRKELSELALVAAREPRQGAEAQNEQRQRAPRRGVHGRQDGRRRELVVPEVREAGAARRERRFRRDRRGGPVPETLNRFGTIIGEKVFHSYVAGQIKRRLPSDASAAPLLVVGEAGRSAPGVSSGAESLRRYLEQSFFVASASEFMTSSACAGCGTKTMIAKPGGVQVAHCRSLICNSKRCPIFSGVVREHFNRRREHCPERTGRQMFHRDLGSCLGIWVHFSHSSLGAALPAHYQRHPQTRPAQ